MAEDFLQCHIRSCSVSCSGLRPCPARQSFSVPLTLASPDLCAASVWWVLQSRTCRRGLSIVQPAGFWCYVVLWVRSQKSSSWAPRLQRQLDLALLAVHALHLAAHHAARLHHCIGRQHHAPAQLRDVDQALQRTAARTVSSSQLPVHAIPRDEGRRTTTLLV